jgi:hypothetical protein
MGSHGWIFATEQSTLWRGAGPVDGHPDLISPFRAELGGLVALLHLTLTICSFYNLSGGQIVKLFYTAIISRLLKGYNRSHMEALKIIQFQILTCFMKGDYY